MTFPETGEGWDGGEIRVKICHGCEMEKKQRPQKQPKSGDGAGISGIPRSSPWGPSGGIWTKRKPIDFRDTSNQDLRHLAPGVFPGVHHGDRRSQPGHLAKLVQMGKVTAVITQNIDGLHQKSGVPDHQVIELHGNANYCKCLECEKRYEMDEIRQIFSNNETLPVCDCGGIIKTATISFGQAMPVAEVRKAEQFALDCDLFIAIGSSLVVYPAAGFPLLAKRNGAKLVILNRDPTGMDAQADLVLNREIGPTLSEVVGEEQ